MPDTQLAAMNKLAKAIVGKRRRSPKFAPRKRANKRISNDQKFIRQALRRSNR